MLNLESLPIRIECFDISNIQGQEIVGSMVVFEDGVAREGALPQVRGPRAGGPGRLRGDGRGRRRAGSRGSRPGVAADEYDESFAPTPNLVVIDGGKGQLAAALEAMDAYDLPRVAVISLAKRDRGGVPARPARSPVLPARPLAGLQLLQRLRDEAHRFAITFHRQRRDAAARESMFDQLDGVGPGTAAGAAAALRLGRARAERDAGGARRGPRRPGEDGAGHLRAAAPRGPCLSDDSNDERSQPSEESPRRHGEPPAESRRRAAPSRRAARVRARSRAVRPPIGTFPGFEREAVVGAGLVALVAFVVYALTVEHIGADRRQRRADRGCLRPRGRTSAGLPALHAARPSRDAASGRLARACA